MDLQKKHCVPCEGGVAPLDEAASRRYLEAVAAEWQLVTPGKAIERTVLCHTFQEALAFINKIGDVAEAEGHHPDLHLHDYRALTVRLSTHAIHGLSENDFIMASKIDTVLESR